GGPTPAGPPTGSITRGPGTGLAWLVAGQIPMTAGFGVFNMCARAAMSAHLPNCSDGRHINPAVQRWRSAARRDHQRHRRSGAHRAILMACMLAVPVLLHRLPLSRVRYVAQLTR